MADSLPLYVVLTSCFPQIFFFLLLGFQLFNEPIQIKQALILSIVGSFVNYCIRNMNVIFGIHSVVTTVSLILVCFFLTRKEFWKIASATVCGMVVFIFIEWLFVFMLNAFNCTVFSLVHTKPWLDIILSIPPTAIIALIYFLIKKRKLYLFNSTLYEIKRN